MSELAEGYAAAIFEIARAEGALATVEDELPRSPVRSTPPRSCSARSRTRPSRSNGASGSSATSSAARPPADRQPRVVGGRCRPGPRDPARSSPACSRGPPPRPGPRLRRGPQRRIRSPTTRSSASSAPSRRPPARRSSSSTSSTRTSWVGRHQGRRHHHRRQRPHPPRAAARNAVATPPRARAALAVRAHRGSGPTPGRVPHHVAITFTSDRRPLTPQEQQRPMAELTINAADIAAALRTRLEGFNPTSRPSRSVASSRSATASPASRAFPAWRVNELARVRGRHARPGAEPRRGLDRCGGPRRRRPHQGGPGGQGHGPDPLDPGRRRHARPRRSTRWATRSTARARSRTRSTVVSRSRRPAS